MNHNLHVTFIINPIAGRGKAKNIAEELSLFLKTTSLSYTIHTTEHPGHGTKLAVDVSKKSDFVIAVGGDGTVNEVAAGVVGTNAILGVLSEGSGNDFARLINAPKKVTDIKKIFDSSSEYKKFDAGKAKITFDHGAAVERYFFNSVGIGFDAAVAKAVSKISWLRGIPLYATALLKTLVGYQPHLLSVLSNGYSKKEKYFVVCIGNGTWEGGGFKLTPNALPDDNIFEVCCVRGKSVSEVIPLLPLVLTGGHISKKNVDVFNSNSLTIEAERAFPVHGDGEIFGMNVKKIEISLIPKCLHVAIVKK